MSKKLKKPNKLPGSQYFSTTLMSSTSCVAAAVMTSYFMLYLTDYSGLGALGATLGAGLLVFARIFDAVNDPLEGWIMDRAKPGKHGKYRPFVLLSIILMSIGVAALFFIPQAITNQPVMVGAYVVVFYLMYDIGYSFYVPELIYRTMTLDPSERGKLLIGPRLYNMVWGMVASALIAIVTAVNVSINNMHTSFGIVILIFCLIAAVLSLVGTFMTKEKYVPEQDEEDPVKITDIISLFKENKPFRVWKLQTIFTGFMYSMMFATANYYIKWGFCTDLTTGAVDTAKFGTFSMIAAVISFMPLLLGTVIAAPIMNKFKSPSKFAGFLFLLEGVSLGLLFVLQVLGILDRLPYLFFACMFLASLAMGTGFVPGGVINMEIMDYDVWKNGKERSALNNSVGKLIDKAQNAFSAAAIGALLASVGYIVDSETDTFLGDLSAMPSLLNWFMVIMGLAPCICGVIGYIIIKQYPINNDIREQMVAARNSKAD